MRQTTKPYISEVSPLVIADTAYKKSYSAITITVADIELINRRRARWGMLKAIGQLVTLFFISCIIVYMVVQEYLPPIDEEKRDILHLPKNLDDLKALNELLGSYMGRYYYNVLIAFTVVYVFLNTFSIPGSMWLSILGGALFGLPVALATVCICSAVGATNCYLLSKRFGKSLVRRKMADRLDRWSATLQAHSTHLLNYIIVLRIAPFPPNWFANIAAPHVGVPLKPFFFGTLLGVAGPSTLHVQAGLTIEKATSEEGLHLFSWTSIGGLALIALAVMIPVWIRKRVEREAEDADGLGQEQSTTELPR
ncbi:528_t:CDS:2 [Paraglomus brasilianum]|uniref:528_t:CDS:1 n=1 Tax=Paraglomus brasilianum TaxID=144538 RepID=A0A9N9A083_9GLOM|nr:528_t:CDS:2 [Paraglomus brasilianum]